VSDQQTVREAIDLWWEDGTPATTLADTLGIDPDMPVETLKRRLEDGEGVQGMRDHFANVERRDIQIEPLSEAAWEWAASVLDLEPDVLKRRLLWGERVEEFSTGERLIPTQGVVAWLTREEA
jgi:hypothetical protein